MLLTLIEDYSNVADVHRLLAYAYLKDGEPETAIGRLRDARSVGTNAQTEIAFGKMLRTRGFFDAALTCFQAAVELEPENLDGLALVAMTYESLGRVDLAIKSGQIVLETADRVACRQPIDPLSPPGPLRFDARRRERNIISFSLFGNDPYYLECAITNASMARAIYPEWQCRFYCAPEIPESCIRSLRRRGAQIGLRNSATRATLKWSGLFWRFLAFDDPNVDFVMIRDVDSPFTLRERLAVEEWIASEYAFHVVRDSISHMEPIMAGLWGGRTGVLPALGPLIAKFLPTATTRYADQHFLRLQVWPRIREMTLTHDRYYTLPNSRRPPIHPTQDMLHIGFGFRKNN